uniref:Uncharacterized protein n=1 Tax=Triticum urartu TaxID=4572 RepID=A0A8R7VHN8_TRIUA
MASPEGSNWVFDCPLMDDLAAADFAAASTGGFYWTPPMQPQMHTLAQAVSATPAPNPCAEINSSVSVDWDHAKGQPKNKRFVYVYMLCSESLNSVFSVECFQLSTQLQQS